MVIPITKVNAEPTVTNVVSNLEELQTALNNDSFTEVIVNNAITLPNGTILDGKGKTVRVEKPYVKENGQLEGSPSTTRVFTIENSSNITIKNMTIMGGQINNSAAISSKGNLTMENVNVVRSNRGLDNDGGITILKKCNFSLNVGQSAGAIWSGNGAKIILDGCSFTQNRSNGGSSYGGGAIGVRSGAYLYANNTIFANNSTQEIGGAINIYGGNVYLMNCTVAGNTTTKSSSCGGGIGKNGGVFHAVNSVFIDNYAKISEDKVRSDIGIYGGSDGTLNNCVYSKIQGSLTSTTNCKVDESNTTASTYTDNGIILSDGSTSASFSHPVLTSGTNPYSKYVIIKASGNAAIGGTSTYFDYSDINNIKMGYGNDSNIIALGDLGTPTSDKKVTTYYEGGSRVNGVIGASGADAGITHTVTFNLNGGTMTGTNPVTVDDGAKVTRPANDPTKDGYVFAGWYANAGFNNEFDFDNTAIEADGTIIYAKWVLITYKVSFNANGGSGAMSDVTDLTGTYTLPESTFTAPSGKQFKGWSLTSDGAIITTVSMTENRTVYAIWEDIHEETLTITGDNQTFTLGNTNDITITCSGALDELTAIKVNGVLLEEANRELASGSTVLTLKNSYLNTLSVGTYTVTFEYGANSKAATLNVVEATNNDDNTNNNTNNNTSNNPQTSYNVVDYVYTLIIGIICLAGGTVYLKRKKLFGNR